MNTQHIADMFNERLLQYYCQPAAIILIQSGPGAGKSWLVRSMAMLSLNLLQERVLITVKTNRQAWAMLQSLEQEYPNHHFHFVHSSTSPPCDEIQNSTQITCSKNFDAVPTGPVLVVATGDKCAHAQGCHNIFDVVLFDEAYQFSDATASLVCSFASRWVFIGDSGQINPVCSINILYWKGNNTAPFLSAPDVLHVRHPDVHTFRLPVTRRLPADTIPFVQAPFYPTHPFVALSTPTQRKISFPNRPRSAPMDKIIARIHDGATMLMPQLPQRFQLRDEEILDRITEITQELLQLQPTITDGDRQYPLEAQHIGIACSHVVDVNHLQNQISAQHPDILIETFHRFQGLERPVMLILHPLSGSQEPSVESMETGLLCVGVSRHLNLCLVFAREGLEQTIESSPRVGDRCMNENVSQHSHNWNSQMNFIQTMKDHNRIFQL